MATVEKIRKDIEKTKEKISAQQKRLRELEAQLLTHLQAGTSVVLQHYIAER